MIYGIKYLIINLGVLTLSCILVTGGTGFIGSHTCVSLIENGYRIIILDSLVNSSRNVINKILEIINTGSQVNKIFNNIDFFEGDLRDRNLLENIFKKYKNSNDDIQGVIHFAGLKSVNESISDPINYWDTNVCSTINLLEIMIEYSCFNIVFSSSATIYDSSKGLLLDELSKINPINTYGKTKAVIEQILNDLFNSSPEKWKIINLRYFNPIGAHSSGLIGEEPKGIPNNIFPLITKVASGDHKEIKIFGNDWDTTDGTGIRDYIHVMDIADGHVKALKYLENSSSKILNINLGTGIGTSVLELIKTFEKVNKIEIPYSFASRRAGDYSKVVADNKSAKKYLNWEPKRDLEQMCRDGWRWRLLNPEGYF